MSQSKVPEVIGHKGWWDFLPTKALKSPISALAGFCNKHEIGLYPKEYNVKVHGPFYPWQWYGKPETPLKDVKLGELGQYMSRRSYLNPIAIGREGRRIVYLWTAKWCNTKRLSSIGIWQFSAVMSIAFYVMFYSSHKQHRHAKYHW